VGPILGPTPPPRKSRLARSTNSQSKESVFDGVAHEAWLGLLHPLLHRQQEAEGPISTRLKTYLDKWRLKHRRSTWLFPSPESKRWDPDNFSQDLRALNETMKLPWGDPSTHKTTGAAGGPEASGGRSFSCRGGNLGHQDRGS
jgi:hypothetical protein